MVGSVFHQEMLLGGRRGRLYVLRWVYVAWLVLQIFFLWLAFVILEGQHRNAIASSGPSAANNPASAPGVVGGWFAPWFVFQQMILLLLATPAFVAGAITDEKRRGTLQYLLTSDLDTRHIILGKMLGRVAQVALLTLAGLPLFALMAGFGGVEPTTLCIVVAVLLAPMFALSAGTLLASVLCRQTRDAVLLLYFLGRGGLVGGGPGRRASGVPRPHIRPGAGLGAVELHRLARAGAAAVGRNRRMGSARLRLPRRGRLAAAAGLRPRAGESGD